MYGPGTVLASRYRLDERVGGGGMGEVWRSTDQVLERTVAVKMMRQELVEEAGFAERFLAEARTMAAIKHPGVVAVHDYRGDESVAFLVMEYVEGEALARRLHRFGRLDPTRTMRLVAQAADALHAAHEKGVVHRDIKPGNLLVTAADTVVLTDFGIARSAASTPLTATGAVVGTPSYLAPEQVLGNPATPRSDVYALGVVAYECLAGRRPFDGDNPFEIAMKRLREPPPTLVVDVPPAVLAVLERTLAADPDQRWQSAAELAAAARQAVTAGATAPAPPPPGPTKVAEPGPTRPAGPGPQERRDRVESPRFAPARAAVPQAKAAPAPAPTILEPRSPSPPPASPLPPASPVPLPASPAPPPYRPATPPPYRPATPPPASAPPPWTKARRPVIVTLASVLLAVAAGALALYFGGSLRVVPTYVDVYEGYLADFDSEAAETASAIGSVVAAVAAAGLVVSLVLVLLTLGTFLGKRAARVWALLLGVLVLCCCGPPIALDSLSNGLNNTGLDRADQAQINERLAETLPDWYDQLSGTFVLAALGALLLAMFLLMLPPADRFFRPRPAAGYHPQRPYYYPHYYGYPPRR
jgi:serine/threonine-protein kinase